MDASQPPLVGTVAPRGSAALQSVPGDDAYHEAPDSVVVGSASAKAAGRRRVHFAATNVFVEPDEPPTFAPVISISPPHDHSTPEPALGQREPMLAAVSPQEVVVEYNRAAVWRLGVAVTLLALPLLYFTPIVGLLLVFPCAHCVYWVRDRVLFHGGGDERSCSNRDCALITGVLGIFSAFVIDVINVVCLVIYLNETPTAPNGGDPTIATEGTGAPVAAMTAAERELRRLELAWGVLLLPLLALLLRHLHRLRHVLSAVDARSQDLVEDYV